MKAIFDTLYDIHRLAPIVYFLIIAIGTGAPTFYAAFKKPMMPSEIYARARAGDRYAAISISLFGLAMLSTAVVFVIVLVS